MTQNIKTEDFQLWLDHPVTQAVRRTFKADREAVKEQWANGAFFRENEFQTAVEQARQFGRLECIRDFLELDVAQLNETEQENGSSGE